MSPKTFLNSRRPSVFASVVSAILSYIAAAAVYAQNPTPGWNDATVEVPGTVEVSTSSLNLQKGKSVSYSLRLTQQPTGDGWWVRVFVDGAVRANGKYDTDGDGDVDITWVPSVGWEFDKEECAEGLDSCPSQWRTIRITASEDAVLNKRVQFDHDVWDHTSNCPVHQVGVVAVTGGDNIDDSRISVSFDRSIYEAEEGGDPATVTVQLGRAPQNSVVIPINDSGEGGASSSDYSVIPSTVTFQSGETRQSFTVTARDDAVDDDNEMVQMSFGRLPEGFGPGSRVQATVSLIDDDDPEVSVFFDQSSYTATEGGIAATVVVELSADPERTVTIPITASPQGGTSSSDYSGIPPSVTFRPSEQQKSFTVTATDDDIDDDNESVELSFGTRPGGVNLDNPARATVTITDDDARGVEVSPTTLRIDEGSSGTYTVVLKSQPTENVMVTVGGASGDVSVESPASQVLTFTTTNWNRMQTVRVRAAEDTDTDADLPVVLTNTVSGGDYGSETADPVTVTVIEDDASTLSVDDVRASESLGTMVFTVTLSKASSNEVTVDYATIPETGTGKATEGSDYTETNGMLTFPASSTASQTIQVPITGDRVDEEEETFTVTLRNVQGGALLAGGGSTLEVTGTIVDDDTRGVRMNRTALGLRKGATGTYTVVLTSEPEATVTVTVGGASNGVTAAPTPLTFTTNDWEMAQTVTVTAAEEAPDGLVVLRHTVSGGDYGPVTAPNVTVRVSSTSQPPPPPPRDEGTTETVSSTPPPPQRTGGPTKVWVSFSAKSYSVVEGGSVGITLRLNKAAGRTVTIPLETANQNGTSDADYSGVPASVTFAANETRKSFQFAAGQDDDYDHGEQVAISFGELPGNVGMVPPSKATVNILDLPEVSVSFDRADYRVTEGDSVRVTVRLNADPQREVRIPLETTPGMGADESDYSGVPSRVLFAPHETEKSFFFRAVADQVDDGGETVAASFASLPSGVTAGNPATATATLFEAVLLSFDPVRYEGTEGQEAMEFTVALSTATYREVTVDYATAAGTATAAEDYKEVAGTLTFAAGTREQTLRVPILDDDEDEAHETFTVKLSAASHAAINVGEATGVILDDDLPVLSISSFAGEDGTTIEDPRVTEGDTLRFTLTRVGDLSMPLQVPVKVTQEGAFLAGEPPTVVEFAADGGTATLEVKTEDDEVDEHDGSISAIIADGETSRIGETSIARVTVEDNDERGIRVAPTTLNVVEGETGTYEVELTSEPTAAVGVAVEVPDLAEVSVEPAELTFTPDNWRGTRTVTVTAAHDPDAMVDDPLTLTHAVSGGDYDGVTAAGVEVVVAEDDSQRVSVSAGELTIEEGATASYTVGMDAEPTGTVTVTVEVPEGAELLVSPTMLTFTPDNWSQPQTVTVTALEDDDAVADDPVVLTHTASGPDQVDVSDAGVEVVVAEDDSQRVSVSAGKLTIEEGATASYTVGMDAEPTGTVTVTVEVPEGAELLVSPTMLTFTPDNWSQPQTVTVTALEDDDAVADDPVVLTHTASGPDQVDVSDAGVEVVVAEDDSQRVSVSAGKLTIEEGATASYTVGMDAEPTGTVTVTVEVPEGAELLVSPTMLTFTPDNWSQPQTVTVTALEDDDAVADDPVVLIHTASGPDQVDVSDAGVEVSISEDDTQGVELSEQALTVAEGKTGTYSVVLTSKPTADVRLEVQVPEGAEISAAPTALTFTPENWRLPQTVTVTAAPDEDAMVDDPVVLIHTVSGGDYGGVSGGAIEVSIAETDTTVLSIGGSSAAEGDGAMEFPVKLSMAASRAVTVEYATSAGSATAGVDYEETSGTLTFTPETTEQTIRVAILDDDVDEPAETFTIALSAAVNATIGSGQATGVILDDDLPVVEIAVEEGSVAEGSPAKFTLTRVGDLSAALQVALQVTQEGSFLIGDPPTEVTFAADEATATVTLETEDDHMDEVDGSVTATVPGGETYRVGAAATATATVIDDDERGITIIPTALTVAEGETGEYTVLLNTAPTAAVRVMVEGPASSEVSAEPTELTFTAQNWSTAQTVTVSADQDDDAVADSAITLNHQVSGGDYQGIAAPTVEVSITEDDAPAVSVSVETLTVDEGETGQYTVALNTEPAAEVTVKVLVPEETDLTTSPSALTFTTRNWSTAQTVTVSADQDDDAVADPALILNHEVSGGDYQGIIASTVEVSITEDDAPAVSVSVETLTVAEGETGQYTVALNTEPAGEVTVKVLVPEETDLTTSPSALTFTTRNWRTAQTVTVSAGQDDDAVADSAITLNHEVSGGDYEGVAAPEVEVSITEDDTPGVKVSVETLTVAEGEDASYTVVLDTEPAGEITIEIIVPVAPRCR